jgi:hypothetical protein
VQIKTAEAVAVLLTEHSIDARADGDRVVVELNALQPATNTIEEVNPVRCAFYTVADLDQWLTDRDMPIAVMGLQDAAEVKSFGKVVAWFRSVSEAQHAEAAEAQRRAALAVKVEQAQERWADAVLAAPDPAVIAPATEVTSG